MMLFKTSQIKQCYNNVHRRKKTQMFIKIWKYNGITYKTYNLFRVTPDCVHYHYKHQSRINTFEKFKKIIIKYKVYFAATAFRKSYRTIFMVYQSIFSIQNIQPYNVISCQLKNLIFAICMQEQRNDIDIGIYVYFIRLSYLSMQYVPWTWNCLF